jgi:hypothetical protein
MLDCEQKYIYYILWKTRGAVCQLDKMMEEMTELMKELLKAREHKVLDSGEFIDQKYNIKTMEEYADVLVTTGQFQQFLENTDMLIEFNGIMTKPLDIVDHYKELKLRKLEKDILDCMEKKKHE